MNGIEKITAKLTADCDQELEAIRSENAAKCLEIKEAGDKAAQEEYWRLVKQGVKDCEQKVSQLSRTAQMEAKKSVLTLKQEMVSKAFDRAQELILELPEEQYVSFLGRMAAEAAMNGMEELCFSARDISGAGKKIVREANRLLTEQGKIGKLTMSDQARPIQGGFVLKQGDIEVNCTIEILAEQCRSALAAQVAAAMFGE